MTAKLIQANNAATRFMGWVLLSALLGGYLNFQGFGVEQAAHFVGVSFQQSAQATIHHGTGDVALPEDPSAASPEFFHFLVDQREARWIDHQDPIGI